MLTVATRERIRSSVPWWLKCALKLALVPVGYRLQRALSLASHGGMRRPQFAHDAFRRHFDDSDFNRKSGGFAVLEMGPGDALTAAVVARAYGAASSCHVDVAPLATRDAAVYRAAARYLGEQGLPAPDLSATRSLDEVLTVCRGRYETGGLASLRALPDASFDLIFSNCVLQCVPPAHLPAILKETRRLVHPRGVCVHSIDLRDMMGQSLHHLRFPEGVWESAYFRRAGFYTNRLRHSEWLRLFSLAGFDVRESEVNHWAALPVTRDSLAPPYRDRSESDLLVRTIRVALFPRADQPSQDIGDAAERRTGLRALAPAVG